MKKSIFKSISHFFRKQRWRYENWKAEMENFSVDLGKRNRN